MLTAVFELETQLLHDTLVSLRRLDDWVDEDGLLGVRVRQQVRVRAGLTVKELWKEGGKLNTDVDEAERNAGVKGRNRFPPGTILVPPKAFCTFSR